MRAVSKDTKRKMKQLGGIIQIILNVLFYVVAIIIIMRFSAAAYELSYQIFGNVTVAETPGVDKDIVIEQGDSTLRIATMLEERGVIVNRYSFLIRAKISISDRHPIIPGSYVLNTSMSYETIIEVITRTEAKEDGVEE